MPNNAWEPHFRLWVPGVDPRFPSVFKDLN
jgi:hypothetical protein